jgi:hypothetical protein
MRNIYRAFYIGMAIGFARKIIAKLFPGLSGDYCLYNRSALGAVLFARGSREELERIRDDLVKTLPPGSFPGEPAAILQISKTIPETHVVSVFDIRGTRGMPKEGIKLINQIIAVLERHGQDASTTAL